MIEDIEHGAEWFQISLEQNIRKEYAANYTSISAVEIINSGYTVDEHMHVIDPFCGSGRLLMGLLRSIPKNHNFPYITINEYMLLPCLFAYYDLIKYYKKHDQDFRKISVNVGDAFEHFDLKDMGKFDLVLMNPPFTRIHRISADTRKNLSSLIASYPQLVTGQPGLHFFALLLANNLLKNDGKIVSILPGSTFVSVYSKPLLEYYLNNYEIEDLIKLDNSMAFSDGSELKEVVFVAKKGQKISPHKIKFSIVNSSSSRYEIIDTLFVSPSDLHSNWNWLKYFENSHLLTLEKHLLSRNLIVSGVESNLIIIRGVEMYGPNFFCIPNTSWDIHNISDHEITIESHNKTNQISIPRSYLIKALRKTGKYNSVISPEFNDYIFSVPPSVVNHTAINEYARLNNENSEVARRKFGDNYLNHIDHQINTKEPFGYLFLPDKLSLETSSIVCHFFDEPISATKNFYIVKGDPQILKLQAAWINSSCFLIIYLVNRREIGGRFGRMQIIDFLNTPLILDFNKISQSNQKQIIQNFDKIRSKQLPRIPDQIGEPYRRKLDLSILESLGYTGNQAATILSEIYITLRQKLS